MEALSAEAEELRHGEPRSDFDVTQKFAVTSTDGPFSALITTLNTLKFAEKTPQKAVFLQDLTRANHAFLAAASYTVDSLNLRALIALSEIGRLTGIHRILFKQEDG